MTTSSIHLKPAWYRAGISVPRNNDETTTPFTIFFLPPCLSNSSVSTWSKTMRRLGIESRAFENRESSVIFIPQLILFHLKLAWYWAGISIIIRTKPQHYSIFSSSLLSNSSVSTWSKTMRRLGIESRALENRESSIIFIPRLILFHLKSAWYWTGISIPRNKDETIHHFFLLPSFKLFCFNLIEMMRRLGIEFRALEKPRVKYYIYSI